ncbi:hypothetical protein V6N13_038687 [Hibiscus sabdariffa]|uniref:Uncharacterized protein n=1 Tax=Hibiscus sabdariffa TaxID=183260 RepID=A0ABR2P3F6_9ROSI
MISFQIERSERGGDLKVNMVEQGGVEEIDPKVEGFTGGGNATKDAVKRGSIETHTIELHARVSRSCEF